MDTTADKFVEWGNEEAVEAVEAVEAEEAEEAVIFSEVTSPSLHKLPR
jgi:hypothetical protein